MKTEQDIRVNLFNTLLTTPHRDLNKITKSSQDCVRERPQGSMLGLGPGILITVRSAIIKRCLLRFSA